MRRLRNAFREWLELRARVREERSFHLDQAVADLHALGLSRREAKRIARTRFGSGRSHRTALREIGGDPAGLLHLLQANRVPASIWLQPTLLLASIALLLLLSPAPGMILASLLGHPLVSDPHPTVFLAVPGPDPLFTGIDSRDFETLRSLAALSDVERYQTIYVRAVSTGASLSAVESEARARTGNPGIRASSLFEKQRIGMGPALTVWLLIAFLTFFRLAGNASQFRKPRWLFHTLLLGCLHTLASMIAWAFGIELWIRIPWPTPLAAALSFASLFLAYLLMAAAQCRAMRCDLLNRCPICLDRLLLAWTRGEANRALLNVATTESLCAHGHGVLIESRWNRHFHLNAA